MLSRSFARRTVSSILIRESRITVICHAFNSSTTNVRSDVIRKVRSHNHPVTTENRASRKGDKSFPDIRLRNIVSSKADGNIPVKPTFGPAFDVLQKREFSIQRIKKITETCGNDDEAYKKHFVNFVKQGKVWPLVLLFEHIEATGVIRMRKNYVNYLLSACVEAKNAELAYTTILKYSNPEYVANQIYLSKINLSTDSQPAAENVGTVIDPAAKTEKHNLTGSAADKNDRNLEGRKSKKAGTKMEFYTPFLRPDSYLIALNACGSCGDPATANRILQVMTVQGIPIDVDSWNAVLNAYAEEKNSSGAQDLFSTMVLKGRAEVPLPKEKSVKGGSSKKNVKNSSNKAAAKVIKTSPAIKNSGINLKSCNLLLKAYGRSGDLLRASMFFDSMAPEHGLNPDSFSWSMLIQAAINCENLSEAVAILDKWLAALKSGMTIGSVSHNHIFNLLITAFLRKRDHKTVEELYERMLLNDIQPNGHTYTSLVSSALESNRRVLANTYFQKMVEEKVPINHFMWRVLTSPLGRTLDHKGYGSMIAYIRMSGSIPTVGMWRDLVGIYGKLGMCSHAEKAMKDMVEVDKLAPDRGCYVRLIRTYTEFEKDWEKGLMLLRELRNLKMEPSSTAWTYVIEACVFSRQWRKRERDKRQTDMFDDGFLRAHKIKKESNINIVFSLIEEMQKVDKIIPDSFLWGTVVNAFSKRMSTPQHDNEDCSESYSSSSVKYENDSDTYFTYFFNNGGKYRVTDEVALLQRFLSLCNEKNKENLFSEILRPLLLASLSVERIMWGERSPEMVTKQLHDRFVLRDAANSFLENFRFNRNFSMSELSSSSALKSDIMREMMRKDARKVFELMVSVNSNSLKNYCDLLRLCANLGETETGEEILSFAKMTKTDMPNTEVTELLLFTYYQNGELDRGLDFGMEVLKRNKLLEVGGNKIDSYLKDVIEYHDDEFDSNDKKGKRLQHLLTVKAVESLIRTHFTPSKNFYTLMFSICGCLGKPLNSLDLHEYLASQANVEEVKDVSAADRPLNRSIVTKRIREVEELEEFLRAAEVFTVDSFIKSNQMFDGQFWALEAISRKLKRNQKNFYLYNWLAMNDKMRKEKPDGREIYDTEYKYYDSNNINRISSRSSSSSSNSSSGSKSESKLSSSGSATEEEADVSESDDDADSDTRSGRKDSDNQAISDLLMPILRIYLRGGQVDNVKTLLTECRDRDIPVNKTLNSAFLLKLSNDGALDELMHIIHENNMDETASMDDKLFLWETAFLGCLQSYEDWSERSTGSESKRKGSKSRRKSSARAEQSLWLLECMKSTEGAPLPSISCWSYIIRALCAAGRSEEAVDILLGLRSLEVLSAEDIDAARAKSGYGEDSNSDNEMIPDVDNSDEDSAPSIPFPSVRLSKGDLSRLWDPILRNRSDNGDLEGCMEIITMLREASIARNVSQWEKVFNAAFIALKPRKISPLNIAKPTPDSDVTTLLTAMMTVDEVQPSKAILHKCLKHFATLDNPVKVVAVLRILKQCKYPITNDIMTEIEDMKRFDLVLDMFGDF